KPSSERRPSGRNGATQKRLTSPLQPAKMAAPEACGTAGDSRRWQSPNSLTIGCSSEVAKKTQFPELKSCFAPGPASDSSEVRIDPGRSEAHRARIGAPI